MHRLTSWWMVLALVIGCGRGGPGGPGTDIGGGDSPGLDAPASDGSPGDTEVLVPPERLVDLVNPFIGSGGRGWSVGSAFVGAAAPFGMVQAGPDATGPLFWPWLHCSGYHASDDTILAFSHTHLHGTGIPDFGAVGFMPVPGAMRAGLLGPGGPASRFRRETEAASPGYYAVTLDDHAMRVELTATRHAAAHRYTPAGAGPVTVLVDPAHAVVLGMALDGGVRVLPEAREIEAWAHTQGEFSKPFGGVRTFVVARVDRPFQAHGTWTGKIVKPGTDAADGRDCGAYVTLDAAADSPVAVWVGVSFTDLAHARMNLEAEVAGRTFDDIRRATEDAWESEMSVIRFEGGDAAMREVMATQIYHAFLMPNEFMDVDGSYLGFDGKVHRADGFIYYTNFSLWDTYRTLHPLLVLVKPERQADMIKSLLAMAEQGGFLPKWPLANGYTNCMIGTPADIVIADSVVKGVDGFDVGAAYDEMLATALAPTPPGHPYAGRVGVEDYLALGYVAADRHDQATSRTLEFAIADAAIANLAEHLGRADDAAVFRQRSRNYRNVWDPDTRFFRGRRADGTFLEPFDPLAFALTNTLSYTEGNAWQYRWLAPHDPEGLLDLFGGPDAMVEALQTFFDNARAEHAAPVPQDPDELTLMQQPPRWYWHGNEPDLHASYLFAIAGRPDLTQEWVRWVATTLYHTGRDGIPGNDDAGTLAAWYVFSALGFLPLPGRDDYVLGAPLFPRAEVRLRDGVLVVEAPGVSDENRYVQSVTLDGHPLTTPLLPHADLARGGTLRFEMGPAPPGSGR